jgi:hypothetical protein
MGLYQPSGTKKHTNDLNTIITEGLGYVELYLQGMIHRMIPVLHLTLQRNRQSTGGVTQDTK